MPPPTDEEDMDQLPPAIRATKKGKMFISTNNYDTDDEKIWPRSPRWREALRWTGVEWEELLPEEDGPRMVVGTTAAELEERRRRNAAQLRSELLKQVMDKREGIKLDNAAKAAAAAKGAASGGGVDTGPGPAAVLAAAQEHMAKLMEASERRIADDRNRLVAAERLAQEKLEQQKKIDAVALQRKQEQFETVKETRTRNLQARLAREEKREVEAANAIVDGRIKEAAREVREAEIAETLRAREKVYRDKSLVFAHKHAIKLNRIAALGEAKEARAKEMASVTERRLADSEAKRVARVEERNKAVKLENKLRNEENEKRRLENKEADAIAVKDKADAITKKLDEVDKRLQETLDADKQRRHDLIQAQLAEERDRRVKLEQMAREKVHTVGAMVGKAEAKDQALERAIKRKEHKLQLRAQDSLLTFQAKKQSVERLMKVKEYERLLAEEALYEKDSRIAEVNQSKVDFKDKRRTLAQQFFVKKAIIKDEMARPFQGSFIYY